MEMNKGEPRERIETKNIRDTAIHLPTCKNRTIDFFVVSNNLAGMVVGAVTVSGALCKPHNPARLYLKACARTMTVRMLRKVGKFGAVLRYRPTWQYDDLESSMVDGLTNDQRYSMFPTMMERELVSLMAVDGKEAEKYLGRTDGPKFVLKNALGNEKGGARKTTAGSRAWRLTVGWLDDLLNTKRQLVVEAAKLNLLTHRHPSPPPSKATPEQMQGFRNFLDWRRRLTREMLTHESWVTALKAAATSNAEREERAAQHASLMKWTQWIHERPADGQRRQHKFTRTVKGWTATAKNTGIVHGIEQSDELDDLTSTNSTS